MLTYNLEYPDLPDAFDGYEITLISDLHSGSFDNLLLPSVSLLVVLTIVYLVFPPAMLGSVAYNIISLGILLVLLAEFLVSHNLWSQRITVGCFLFGIFGWIYYQTVSTTYGMLGIFDPTPFVHEMSRAGEAFMVLASILVFWAYGTTSFFTKNINIVF